MNPPGKAFDYGYNEFRSRVEQIARELGDHAWVRNAVLNDATWTLNEVIRSQRSYKEIGTIWSSLWLIVSPNDLIRTTEFLERMTSIKETPITAESEAMDGAYTTAVGRLRLRGVDLFYETDRRSLLMAHAGPIKSRTRGQDVEKWSISMTFNTHGGKGAAEAFFDSGFGRKPSQSGFNTGSEAAAQKALRRIAEEAFLAPLRDVEVVD